MDPFRPAALLEPSSYAFDVVNRDFAMPKSLTYPVMS
jgi:hypothetical protein